MAEWLLKRLFDSGDQPTPRFAAQSTLNWMRSLAIIVEDRGFTDNELSYFYAPVQRRTPNTPADTGVFECLLMAEHNVAALRTLSADPKSPYNVVRSAIIAWYYAIYESSSAMTLASSGANAETHAKTARIWHTDVVKRSLTVGPFGLYLDTLVASDVKTKIVELRQGSQFELVNSPSNYMDAWGAAMQLRQRNCRLRKMAGRRDNTKKQGIQGTKHQRLPDKGGTRTSGRQASH